MKGVRKEGGNAGRSGARLSVQPDRLVWWYVLIPLTLMTWPRAKRFTHRRLPPPFFPLGLPRKTKQSFPPLCCAYTLKHRGVWGRNKLTGNTQEREDWSVSECRVSLQLACHKQTRLQTQPWVVFSKHRLWQFRKSTERVSEGQAAVDPHHKTPKDWHNKAKKELKDSINTRI